MSGTRILWIIITPVFRPAPGGGAIYTDLLARGLAEAGDDVAVFTERYPGEPDEERLDTGPGEAVVHRIFPLRAGRADKDWRSYAAYALANLQYLRLPAKVKKLVQGRTGFHTAILVHSSLLYYANILKAVLNTLRRVDGYAFRLIADVRDRSFPSPKLRMLDRFDAVVTSSQAVADDLLSRRPGLRDVVAIPMPFAAPPRPSNLQIRDTLSRFGLGGRRFLLNPNGISIAKHYPAMRDAIPLLRSLRGFQDIVLVTAGRGRDRTTIDIRSEQMGHTLFLGAVPRRSLLALMSAATATLVLSDREAISRSALEAMSIGGQVVLPDLEEFRRHCRAYICSDPTPKGIVERTVAVAAIGPPRFDFKDHMTDRFVPRYRGLVAGMIR